MKCRLIKSAEVGCVWFDDFLEAIFANEEFFRAYLFRKAT